MPRIFISYRREDSQHQADRLHAALKKSVRDPKRDIFIDIDNIPVGVDFVQHLNSKVEQCDVLLALIGPGWLKAGETLLGGRRLNDPKDFVRIEIAAALARNIPVVPVLLDGVSMPKEEDLPPDLKPLVRRQAAEIRRTTFDADATRLIRGLGQKDTKAAPSPRPAAPAQTAKGQMRWVVPASAILGVGAIAAALWAVDPFGWNPKSGATVPDEVSAPVSAIEDASASVVTPDMADPTSLRKFLAEHGTAPAAETARMALAKLDAETWARAVEVGTEDAFATYLRAFPLNVVPAGAKSKDADERRRALESKRAGEDALKKATASSRGNEPKKPAAEIAPPNLRAASQEERDAFSTARNLMIAGDFPAGEKALAGFLTKYPVNELTPDAMYYLGEARIYQDRYNEALGNYDALVSAYPGSGLAPQALVRGARALRLLGSNTEACRKLDRLPELYPSAGAVTKELARQERLQARC